MKWYKKAKIENYPIWLANKLMQETKQYKNLESPVYPGVVFPPQHIKLVEEWIKETNPEFENLTLQQAIKQAKIHYENKKITKKLTKKDINKNNLLLTLLSKAYEGQSQLVGQIDPNSIKIQPIQAVYPNVKECPTGVYNYIIYAEFETARENEPPQKWLAMLATKDGQYFIFMSFRKYDNP